MDGIYAAKLRLCDRAGLGPFRGPDLEEIMERYDCLCRIYKQADVPIRLADVCDSPPKER